MSHVEVFATGIKIESSDQSPFLGADQEIKATSELMHGYNLTFDPENQLIKSLRTIKHTFC